MDFVLLPSSIEPLQTRLICLCGESTEASPFRETIQNVFLDFGLEHCLN